jgi:hypothetical protein
LRPIVACAYSGVFIEPLPGNTLTCHNMNSKKYLIRGVSVGMLFVELPSEGKYLCNALQLSVDILPASIPLDATYLLTLIIYFSYNVIFAE